MQTHTRLVIAMLIAGYLAFGQVAPGFALQIVPGYQILRLDRGEETVAKLSLTNTDAEEIRIIPEAKNWELASGRQQEPVQNWLIPLDQPFTLKPGDAREVSYKVVVPKNTKGELLGLASFLTERKDQKMVNLRMSVSIYAIAKGTEDYDAAVKEIVVEPLDNAVRAGARIMNKGNVHMRFAGLIQIYDEKHNPLANIRLQTNDPIYPGEEGLQSGTVSGVTLGKGRYWVQLSFTDIDQGRKLETGKRKFEVKKKKEIVIVK